MSVSAERDPVATVPLPTAHPYHSEPPQDARLLANDAVRAVRARRRLDDGPEDNPCSVMHDFCAEHCCTLCGTLNGRTVDFRRSTYRTCPASCASRPSRTAGGDQSRKTRKTSRMKKTPAPRSPAGILGPDWGCSLVTWTFILLPPILILGFGGSSLNGYILALTIIVCVAVSTIFALTAYSDPGYLVRQTEDQAAEQRAQLVEAGTMDNYTFCETCLVYREHHTHHCQWCDVCVIEADHHCPWTGKCIGKYNLGYFRLFLWAIALHMGFCMFALFGWTLSRS